MTQLPPQTWRLLITPPLDGATNMAIDEAILRAQVQGQGQPTLRFYQWKPACLSLGFGQRCREVNQQKLDELGYTWVRRPTGGRAILHINELTYSLIAPEDNPCMAGGIIPSYRRLSRGLLAGLHQLGALAAQAKGDMPKNPEQGTACFDTPSHYEVTLNGKKLAGSAQMRRKGMVLQHGSLPLLGDIGRIFEVLQMDLAEKEKARTILLARATTLEAELHQIIDFDTAAQALQRGFIQALNLTLRQGELSTFEQNLANDIHAEKYGNLDWNARR